MKCGDRLERRHHPRFRRRIELRGRKLASPGIPREEATTAIRGPDVTAVVSTIAAVPAVRAAMVRRQRAWVEQHGGGVVEGRDIGTVVFPDAELKVFLTASDEERARRRQRDEAAPDVQRVASDLARRDHLDSTRAVSPLVVADDALVIDTTGRGADDVVEEIVRRLQ